MYPRIVSVLAAQPNKPKPTEEMMPKYLETAKELNALVEALIVDANLTPQQVVDLGHIVNLTVRCSPRGVQGTVRKNIVDVATGNHCVVSMAKVEQDNGYSYNKISIQSRGN